MDFPKWEPRYNSQELVQVGDIVVCHQDQYHGIPSVVRKDENGDWYREYWKKNKKYPLMPEAIGKIGTEIECPYMVQMLDLLNEQHNEIMSMKKIIDRIVALEPEEEKEMEGCPNG